MSQPSIFTGSYAMSTVSSLENIERPMTKGEDLFVHLIVELLVVRVANGKPR